MYSLTDPIFWINFIFFIGAVFFAYYIPGNVILRRYHLDSLTFLGIEIPLGIALWAWQGYVLGYAQIRWASYIYLLLFFVLWIRKLDNPLKTFPKTFQRLCKDPFMLSIILIGSLTQLSIILFTGVRLHGHTYFCCGNIDDNWWFAAVTQQLVHKFPPLQPGVIGVLLQNYHYWSNLVVADLIRIFHLPLFATQFQYSGLLISLLLGCTAISFARMLKLPKMYTHFFLFFLYFGSDALYWLLLFLTKKMSFSMSGLEDGVHFLANLPRAYSIIVFWGGLNLLILWLRTPDVALEVLIALIFASLFGFKVYLGIFALIGLATLAFYQIVTKKDFHVVRLVFLSGLLSLVVYLPANSAAGGLFFIGFWRFENFIVQPALGLIRLELAREIFVQHNNWIHAYLYDILFLCVYLFGIFGTKLLAVFQTPKSLRSIPTQIHVFLLSGIAASFFVGSFFQQNVGAANTFNFLATVFIVSSIYAALSVWYWYTRSNSWQKLCIIILIVFFTLPRSLYETTKAIHDVQKMQGYSVPLSYEEAIEIVDKDSTSKSIIFVDSSHINIDQRSPTIGLLTNRQSFYSGQTILEEHRVNTSKEEIAWHQLFKDKNTVATGMMLNKFSIEYIFVATPSSVAATESAQFLDTLYQGSDIAVLKVSKQKLKEYLLPFSLP